jgi:hypothetical protein
MMVRYLNTIPITEPDDVYPPIAFKPMHEKYVPIGSVEFVSEFLQHFYGLTPKPINVPEELFSPQFSHRPIYNGTEADVLKLNGRWFVKSNDKIKGFTELLLCDRNHVWGIPKGNYQISAQISIESEWRAFVFDKKLVGLRNYAGEFTKFPNVYTIESMIRAYKSAPVAYTLDVGINSNGTFVIECHDFFSCGLYGFDDHAKLPLMYHRWFWQYIQREMVEQRRDKL